jgi:hypothetical protein
MSIHPGIGIGPIRLGMHPQDVLAAMNEPQAYEEWMGGNLNDSLLFQGVIFSFSEYDGTGPLPSGELEYMYIRQRFGAYLFDKPIEQWSRDQIIEELNSRGLAFKTTEYGDVFVPSPALELGFSDDQRLIAIAIEC